MQPNQLLYIAVTFVVLSDWIVVVLPVEPAASTEARVRQVFSPVPTVLSVI